MRDYRFRSWSVEGYKIERFTVTRGSKHAFLLPSLAALQWLSESPKRMQ